MNKEQQNNHANFFWRFLVIVGGGLLIFLVFVLMFRINYKVRAMREGFWSIAGWIAFVIFILIVVCIVGIWLLNVTSRQGYEEDIYDDDEVEKAISEDKKKKTMRKKRQKKKTSPTR